MGLRHSKTDLTELQSRFSADELAVLLRTYEAMVQGSSHRHMIDKGMFRKIFDLPGILSERVFDAFDVDRIGAIDFEAFLRGLSSHLRGTPENKLKFLFRIYDLGGRGAINRAELKTVLSSVMFAGYLIITYQNDGSQLTPQAQELIDRRTDEMVEDAFRGCPTGRLGQADFAAWAREHNTVGDIISFLIRERKTVASLQERGGGGPILAHDQWLTLDRLLHRSSTDSSGTRSSSSVHSTSSGCVAGPHRVSSTAGAPVTLDGPCEQRCLWLPCQGCHYILRVSYCPQCGSEMEEQAGTKLACRKCGRHVDCHFCVHCGRRYSEQTEPVFGQRVDLLGSAAMKGHLWKLGKIFRKLVKQRWCVIQGNFLHTFRSRKSIGPSHVICLENCFAEPLAERPGSSRMRWGLELYSPICDEARVFFCATREDRDQWVGALRNAARHTDLEQYYEIEEEIGHGRFSKVYRCRRREDDKVFALKVIDKSSVGQDLRPLLRNEVAIHQFVHHQNIVTLKNVFETQSRIQLIMEFIPGGDLCERLNAKGPYSETKARSIFVQILTAIQYLHERGIVHRDLKLENIMVESEERDDRVLLVDFGLSKFTAPDQMMMRSCGTLEYAAPEIMLRTGYGREIDMWSAGIVLYALLSARMPFAMKNVREACRNILSCNFNLAGPAWDDISEDAKDMIRRLLHPQPNLRMTIHDALQHPWLSGYIPEGQHHPS